MKLKLHLRIAELRACPGCKESGGIWASGHPGKRCTCTKGQLLAKADRLRSDRARLKEELRDAEQSGAAA